MIKTVLNSLPARGFLFGALLYGGPLAWIHGAHNGLASSRDTVVVWLAFCFLYGAWGAAAFLGGWLWARLQTLLRGRGDEGLSGRKNLQERGLFWGILAFNLAFWEPFFLYGLTYDQVPLKDVDRFLPMAVFLAAAAVIVALMVALVSWFLHWGLLWLERRNWLRGATVGAGVLSGLVLAAQPWWTGASSPVIVLEAGQMKVDPEGGVEVAATIAQEGAERGVEPKDIESERELGDSLEIVPKPTPEPESALKVVLIGLDGADWRVIDPLLRVGALPAFSHLVDTGTRAALETFPDANSAVIWASIYSGRSVEAHGIHDFYRVEIPGMTSPGIYPVHRTFFKELSNVAEPLGLVRRTLVSRYSLHSPLLWEIADHEGISTGIVDGYLYSFPAPTPKVEDSYFLAYGLDAFARDVGGGGGGQPGVADLPLFLQPPGLFRGLRDILDRGDFYWQSAALLRLLEDRRQPRLVNFYTHEPDSVQHQQWKWYEPSHYWRVDADEVSEKKHTIPNLHRDFDDFLGQLQEKIDPQTVVVVASDHGHSPTPVHKLYTQHRHGPPGILLLAGGPVKAGAVLDQAHVLDIFPTLLYLLGLPIPEDAEGEVLWDALDPAFVAAHPPRTVPSFDFLNQGYGGRSGGLGENRNQQELDKLKSLGYI
ncbi:MAG: alkaline phosphatase family protein [Deltaproteobacteria bacterium]|nr:alkaline phosphatase family protein [Deltaproteobacteria bacterium]